MFTIDDAKCWIADHAHQNEEYDGYATYEDCDCMWCIAYAALCDIEHSLTYNYDLTSPTLF
jgi:hypothetical protein